MPSEPSPRTLTPTPPPPPLGMPSTSVDGAQLDSVLLTGIVAHGLTLCICVGWTGWSVYRHGWRKRSTRRFSYYLYIVLHALRLCWLVALSHSGVEGTLDMSELDSPTAALLNRVALCIGHNAFSMVVFGARARPSVRVRTRLPLLPFAAVRDRVLRPSPPRSVVWCAWPTTLRISRSPRCSFRRSLGGRLGKRVGRRAGRLGRALLRLRARAVRAPALRGAQHRQLGEPGSTARRAPRPRARRPLAAPRRVARG